MSKPLKQQQFFRGQWVEVRSLPEILATLDDDGKLEGLPFMPEMARFCGRRVKVARRADKTCVEGYGVRLMGGTVFLEDLRCDGSCHDGCQRNCLMFWKEAWLKPADGTVPPPSSDAPSLQESAGDVARLRTRAGDLYFCQSTELAGATRHLSRWNLGHFVTDILHAELSLARLLQIVGRMALNRFRALFGLRKLGALAGRQKGVSKGDLDLQPGDWVEVKRPEEIEVTLNPTGKNAGLSFEPDMLEFCGGRYEVDFAVQRIILEETGRMVQLSRTVALKGVTCQGLCAKNCPRGNPLYWREAWLKRSKPS